MWSDILKKSSNNAPIKTSKAQVKISNIDNSSLIEDVNNHYDYKYGDKIFNDIYDFYQINQHNNLILRSIKPSMLVSFFDEYIEKHDYYIYSDSSEEETEDEEYDTDN